MAKTFIQYARITMIISLKVNGIIPYMITNFNRLEYEFMLKE